VYNINTYHTVLYSVSLLENLSHNEKIFIDTSLIQALNALYVWHGT